MIRIDDKNHVEKYAYGWILYSETGINKKTRKPTIRKQWFPTNLIHLFQHLLSNKIGKEKNVKKVLKTLEAESKNLAKEFLKCHQQEDQKSNQKKEESSEQ